MQYVKIGPKGKHLIIPDGWFLVADGVCETGDLCANISNPNNPRWMVCSEDEEVGDLVENFEALIRRCK